MKKGIFFTLMGVTNLGKTTQLIRLTEKLINKGKSFAYVKYPIYSLEPTGPSIHKCLKQGNPNNISALGLQELNVQNRSDFEPRLKEMLSSLDIVIAEMYTGTGIAYGTGDGLNKDHMIEINKHLLLPTVSVLLDGKRFMDSVEAGHRFETDDEKTERIRLIHLDLAKEFNWSIVNANRSVEEVHDDIWEIVSPFLVK
ncbi:MAG: hypothetical protein KBD26_00655 [Candidatus Pacebacteria bacterium]|nr:hypothetical protein [Candidatus Paceibacterota bacterium]MBP9772320.1 hypothetical protein [Candidatus Paceibacterota bacterium]QQR76836.1 MAG: hypothetical protein IPJ63_01025 [Candidatus Nomurabacteria bacterium]